MMRQPYYLLFSTQLMRQPSFFGMLLSINLVRIVLTLVKPFRIEIDTNDPRSSSNSGTFSCLIKVTRNSLFRSTSKHKHPQYKISNNM